MGRNCRFGDIWTAPQPSTRPPWALLLLAMDLEQIPIDDALLVVRQILAHLRLPTTLSPPAPARLDVQLGFDLDFDQTEPPAPGGDSIASSCRDPPSTAGL